MGSTSKDGKGELTANNKSRGSSVRQSNWFIPIRSLVQFQPPQPGRPCPCSRYRSAEAQGEENHGTNSRVSPRWDTSLPSCVELGSTLAIRSNFLCILRSIMKTVSQPRPIFLGVAQLEEHAFWKREVAGASPVTQTNNQTTKTSTNNWRY